MSGEYDNSGMIALIPADPHTFVVPGGDKADEIHVTLAYLGDRVDLMSPAQRDALFGVGAALAINYPVFQDEVFGHALWNPNEKSCAVYELKGKALLAELHTGACGRAGTILKRDFPEQHAPYRPHITAGYGITPDKLSYVGPVSFDTIRVALGGTTKDYAMSGTSLKAAMRRVRSSAGEERYGAEISSPIVRRPKDRSTIHPLAQQSYAIDPYEYDEEKTLARAFDRLDTKGRLERVPGVQNWVDRAGGLPDYIDRIANHLHEKGMSIGHAIATAVNAVKKMCSTGDLNWPSLQHVNLGSRAEACKAVAQWEAMKKGGGKKVISDQSYITKVLGLDYPSAAERAIMSSTTTI